MLEMEELNAFEDLDRRGKVIRNVVELSEAMRKKKKEEEDGVGVHEMKEVLGAELGKLKERDEEAERSLALVKTRRTMLTEELARLKSRIARRREMEIKSRKQLEMRDAQLSNSLSQFVAQRQALATQSVQLIHLHDVNAV